MNEILEDTLKVADEIKKTNKLLRAMKTKDHDEKLQKINQRLSLLADQATFLIMVKYCNLCFNYLLPKLPKFKMFFIDIVWIFFLKIKLAWNRIE